MITQALHYHLLAEPTVRPLIAEYGVPSAESLQSVRASTRATSRTVEMGFSLLSLVITSSGPKRHSAILPSLLCKKELLAFMQKHGLSIDSLDLLVGDPATCLHRELGEIDHIVLSWPMGFPTYFGAADAAFKLLRKGGRLSVRGNGTWTVEQLKNFLRVDPGWHSYQLPAPDLVTVTRSDKTVSARWSDQPYVAVNSFISDTRTLAELRSKPLYASVAAYSNEIDQIVDMKSNGKALPSLGLVGYYGFGNFGDELFRLAFERAFPDYHLSMLHDVPRRPYFLSDKKEKVAAVEGIIIGGGDILIPGYWSDFYFEREFLDKPVYIHGVGVPRWTGGDPGVMRRLRDFLQHRNVKCINVRDTESRDWILKHLKPNIEVNVFADIVCGMDLPNRTSSFNCPKKMALITRRQNAKSEEYRHLRELTRKAKQAGYIVLQIIAGAGLVGAEDRTDALTNAMDADAIVSAESVEEIAAAISDCDVVASMKFHGCVVGVMSGVPTFGLLKTDKFLNFYRSLDCEEYLIPFQSDEVVTIMTNAMKPVSAEKRRVLADDAKAGMRHLRAAVTAGAPPASSCP